MIFRNIIANYFGSFMIVVAPLIALPFYLNLLGDKLFGLISFVAAIQALLSLLDSGISQVAIREFSVRAKGQKDGALGGAKLLLGFERMYWLSSVTAGIVMSCLAGFVATKWLNLEYVDIPLGEQAVIGAAILFAVQFPGSLYRSFLVATEKQVQLNIIMVGGVLLRHTGGVLLAYIYSSLSVYLVWLVFSAMLETVLRGKFAWRASGVPRRQVCWDSKLIKGVLPNIVKLSGAVLMGSLASQMDKIILSKMVSIEQFGYYAIASTVSLGVLNLIYPIMQGFSPRIMQLSKDYKQAYLLNVKLFKVMVLVVFLAASVFLLGGELMIEYWLKDLRVASAVYGVLSILLIGSAFHAIYHVGYYNWLSQGVVKKIYIVNILSLIASLIFIPVFIDLYGMIGATFGFVTMNFIGLMFSLDWVKYKGMNKV